MRIFKDMDLVEQLGSGIPRIVQYYGKECFYFSDNYTRMSFPVEEKQNVTENVTEKRKQLIIYLIHEEPQITTTEIANRLNVTRRTVARDIDTLKANEIIKRIGSAKSGYWKIMK